MHFHLVNLIWVGAIQYTEIVFVYKSIHPKIRLGTKNYFSAEIGVLFEILQHPDSEHTACSMIINFEALGRLNLVRV